MCCAFSYQIVFLVFCLGAALVSGQNWLIGSVFPVDYDKTEPPVQDGNLSVEGSVMLNSFTVADDQRVRYTVLKH